jgi:hypothetical protein
MLKSHGQDDDGPRDGQDDDATRTTTAPPGSQTHPHRFSSSTPVILSFSLKDLTTSGVTVCGASARARLATHPRPDRVAKSENSPRAAAGGDDLGDVVVHSSSVSCSIFSKKRSSIMVASLFTTSLSDPQRPLARRMTSASF